MRRLILPLLSWALVLAGCAGSPTPAPSPTSAPSSAAGSASASPTESSNTSLVPTAAVTAAREHLAEVLDEWGDDGELRLASSYQGGDLDDWDTAVSYDAALMAIALARSFDGDDLERAKTIADVLVKVQADDPIGDGRVRDSYDPAEGFDGAPPIASGGSALGNVAWVGMALVQVHVVSQDPQYLEAAEQIGEWIIDKTWDDRGAGGFTGGRDSDDDAVDWKSTEHNIDAAGLFGMLYQITRNDQWGQAHDHAVESMWDADAGYFHIGTTTDGETINDGDYIPGDVQSRGNLLLRDAQYYPALDWVTERLQVTDDSGDVSMTGIRFAEQTDDDKSDHNDDVVWLEGTAQASLALRCAARPGDVEQATQWLSGIVALQEDGPNANGKGIQANSSVGCSGGDDTNYTSLHVGATSWFIMAAQGVNPFQLPGNYCR